MKLATQALFVALMVEIPVSIAQLSPAAPVDCGLSITLQSVGSIMPGNLNAPVTVGKDLYLINQGLGKIYLDEKAKGNPVEIFDIAQAPAGLTFGFADTITEYVSNISPGPSENELYVGFQSTTLPPGLTAYGSGDLPAPIVESHSASTVDGSAPITEPEDLYRLGEMDSCFSPTTGCCLCSPIFPDTNTIFHVIYKFSIQGSAGLTNPVPLAAFATQSGPTHKGGGMATLPTTGELLFATGDGLPFGTNGRQGAQDDTTSVSKLFKISPTGDVVLLAKGLRQPQRLEIVDTGDDTNNEARFLAIGEIGGVTAEEVNVAPLDGLLDTSVIDNFGWGIGAGEDFGREGTFYNGPGIAGIFGTQPPAIGLAPIPEAGYTQPHAQYGRFDPSAFIAVSGPVTSRQSFDLVKVLFVDLPSGQFMATTFSDSTMLFETDEQVCTVGLLDDDGVTYQTANAYFGSETRVDPRLFRFPNGKAGVLFEVSGEYFVINEH